MKALGRSAVLALLMARGLADAARPRAHDALEGWYQPWLVFPAGDGEFGPPPTVPVTGGSADYGGSPAYTIPRSPQNWRLHVPQWYEFLGDPTMTHEERLNGTRSVGQIRRAL